MKKNILSYFAVLFLGVAMLLAACGVDDAPVEDVPIKKWGTPELIETSMVVVGDALFPQVAMDSGGNAMAVWPQSSSIWANHYELGTGWGTPELIGMETVGGPGHYLYPEVAMDPYGNAIAIWQQLDLDGKTYSIWAARYVTGTGWTTAELLEDGSGYAYYPQVAFDSDGNATAVWWQWAGPASGIWANRYVAGTGWGAAEPIDTDNSGEAYGIQLAVDSGGNAMAVWYQYPWDFTALSIRALHYVKGTGWGPTEIIDAGFSTGLFCVPQVAFDSQGNAMAVWQEIAGANLSIWANRYVAGTGWGTAELLDTDPGYGDGGTPQVAFDSQGNAMVIWSKMDEDGQAVSVWAKRYVAGTGWDDAELIETGSGYAGNPSSYGCFFPIDSPQLAYDSDNNAVAIWPLYALGGGLSNIWSNRYVAGTGWGSAEVIDTGSGSPANPWLALEPGGNAIAVWSQWDGTNYNIWANRFE